jgi:hypothetical protein
MKEADLTEYGMNALVAELLAATKGATRADVMAEAEKSRADIARVARLIAMAPIAALYQVERIEVAAPDPDRFCIRLTEEMKRMAARPVPARQTHPGIMPSVTATATWTGTASGVIEATAVPMPADWWFSADDTTGFPR